MLCAGCKRCCARAANGHVAAALPSTLMKSRRRIASLRVQDCEMGTTIKLRTFGFDLQTNQVVAVPVDTTER